MGYWDFLSEFGKVAGDGAASAAGGRKTEAELGLDQDRLRLTDLALRQKDAMDRAQLELDQKKFGLAAPKARTQSAALGDLFSNVQDVKINRPAGVPAGNISGGLRPSALGANARAAGAELSRQSLDALMSGKDTTFSPVASLPAFTPTPIPKASGWEDFLSKAGMGSSLAGALLNGGKNGNGGDSGGNLSPLLNWLKDKFTSKTGTPSDYQRPNGGTPSSDLGYRDGDLVGPDGQPFDWYDYYSLPTGDYTGMPGFNPDDFNWQQNDDGSWGMPAPSVPDGYTGNMSDLYDSGYWY